MKSICIVTSKYPTPYNRSALAFVQQLAFALTDSGLSIAVVCPIPINIEGKKGFDLPFRITEKTKSGNKLTVYFPKYIGFGQQNLKYINTATINLYSFSNAVKRTLISMNEKPEVIYGHFISPAGVTAAQMGREFNIPSYLAYGESSPWSINNLGIKKVRKELKTLEGVVAVSTKNKNELVSLGVVDNKKIEVIPNAVDNTHFYKRNKNKAREKFNLPKEKFIIAFVGHFIERKGLDKVIESIKQIDDAYGIYAGKGPISTLDDKTLYSNLIEPNDLPWFYSAADVFVLPTLNEGCCNAIIEAMACGLPIISSDLPFNDDILDETCSIRVNPNEVSEITNSIKSLMNNKENLDLLSKGALVKGRNLTLNERAKKIINYIS